MKCLLCNQFTPDAWESVGMVPGSGRDFTSLTVEWMRCANRSRRGKNGGFRRQSKRKPAVRSGCVTELLGGLSRIEALL
jgi:hypothetical protein